MQFFGERLIRVDAKLQAPGDANKIYEAWQKKLSALLGSNGSVKREGNRRVTSWKTSVGGTSGKGEIVILQTMPNEALIQVLVHDAELSKPN